MLAVIWPYNQRNVIRSEFKYLLHFNCVPLHSRKIILLVRIRYFNWSHNKACKFYISNILTVFNVTVVL